MRSFDTLIRFRRSTRNFTDGLVSDKEYGEIMMSALIAPTSKNCQSWEFVVIEEKETLKQLSVCKDSGSAFLEKCALAIVVLGNKTITDIWVEDAAIAAAYMQLQAEDIGIGSCWCHIRNRMKGEASTEQIVRDLLEIPDRYGVLCIIGFGRKTELNEPRDLYNLTWDKVHIEKYKISD